VTRRISAGPTPDLSVRTFVTGGWIVLKGQPGQGLWTYAPA
jgi:hypothetical protein